MYILIYVICTLFPTCQVRVVRFYHNCSSTPLPPLPPLPPPPSPPSSPPRPPPSPPPPPPTLRQSLRQLLWQ